MDPITVAVRVMLISFLHPLIFHGASDACLFGSGCAFPCNCNNGDTCNPDTGSCPSCCKSGQPPGLGYGWTGPGCQIGNVAYNKTTNQTGVFLSHYSHYAVDGNIGSPQTGDDYCAHPDNNYMYLQPAEWTVDLGDTYTVYNVTIYNSHNAGGSIRLTNFDLWVEETSARRELCAYYNDTAPAESTSLTIQCGGGSGYVGRYVHLRRREGIEEADRITLCEVIVWGHKYIDCSACPAGTSCSNITGCDRCQIGKQLPDCKQDCADGFYGVNCGEICGHCKSPSDCDPVTGSCLHGCQLWWASNMCKTKIDACRFGNGANCGFPCNCLGGSQCNSSTGHCDSGCKTGQPTDNEYRWTGPGCQIGNVAYNKDTNQTGAYEGLFSSFAVDGNIGSNGNDYCAHPFNPDLSQPVEWTVDLGDTYTVYNVTIYNTNDGGGFRRLTDFDLWVERTSQDRDRCAYYSGTPVSGGSVSIQCGGVSGYVGRYVHIRRREGANQAELITLCEVIVWGHRYIDCSACPAGTSCSNITGCDRCQVGKQLPDCKQDCADGFHGVNCAETCGHCKSPSDCDPVTSSCLYGCQLWWAGDTCDIVIVLPGCCQGDEGLDPIEDSAITSSSVTISWTQETSVPQGYDSYYGYIVKYRKDGEAHRQFERIPHDSKENKLKSVVTGLDENTLYHFKVTPYRKMENQEEAGRAYVEQSIETKCSVPEKPVIISVIPSQDNTSFTLHYKLPDYKNNGCYEVVFQYKDSLAASWIERFLPRTPRASSVTVGGLTKDSYYARIRVSNKDAETFSETYYVSFTEPPQTTLPTNTPVTDSSGSQDLQSGMNGEKSSNTAMIIAVSVVVVVIVVAATVIVVVILVLRNRRRQTTKEETSVSYVNQNVTIGEATSTDEPQEHGQYEDVIIDDPHHALQPEQSQYHHLDPGNEHDYENKFNTGPYATINN